jgi:glutamine amidotransferase
MIAIVDYGVGNLFSLVSSFRAIGTDVIVTSDAETLATADKILLPGVGAFEDARRKLRESGLEEVIRAHVSAGKPIMGICLGMQLLFERSFEYGEHEGLGLLRGDVIAMDGMLPGELKIPHIGWNALHVCSEHPVFKYIKDGDFVYFVHSYYATSCDDSLLATTEYGKQITAAVALNNVMGMQFHPEKSGEVGLNILRAFAELEA